MADEDKKDVEEQKDAEKEKTDEKTSGTGFLRWIIMAVVVALCAGAGFGVGRFLTGSSTPETAESSQQDEPARLEDLNEDGLPADEKVWYYDLEPPTVANLDEPGVTRYVRVSLTLAIGSGVDQKKGNALLEEKNPLLRNWLAIYLASLNLEDIRGDKNLMRIQLQILDAFNEKLFPDAKPQIRKILFKEFAVQ